MTCPYPNCGGDTGPIAGLAPCATCKEPLLSCAKCQAENRSLARFCRNCGEPISHASLETLTKSLRDRIKPRHLGEVRSRSEEVVSHGGSLWLISKHGELYQISSAVNQLNPCATLPGGGFSFPLKVVEDDIKGPLIYTNNNQSFFRYSILSGKVQKVFELEANNSTFASGVVKRNESYYYLTREAGGDSCSQIVLKCSESDLSYSLSNLTFFDSLSSPLHQIGNDLWLIAREKIIVFPNFSSTASKEWLWNPWHLWVTNKGIWYSEKVETGYLGNKQSVWRVTFEEKEFERYALDEGLLVTARIAVSQVDGRAATFTPQAIKLYDFAMNNIDELTGIVQVQNPEGILLASPFLVWFDNHSVYAWHTRTPKVYKLWSFAEEVNFSQFFMTGGSLYGLTEEEIWRWDLLDV